MESVEPLQSNNMGHWDLARIFSFLAKMEQTIANCSLVASFSASSSGMAPKLGMLQPYLSMEFLQPEIILSTEAALISSAERSRSQYSATRLATL